jgi:hypothetical protein
MSKSWPIKQNAAVECKQIAEVPKPWPQPWPSPVDCGQDAVVVRAEEDCGQAVAVAKAEIEIDSAEVVSFVPGVTTLKKKGLAPPWKPGQSGNPKGRPVSSKHKITETMRAIIAADVTEHAAEALAQLRREDIAAYFAVVLKFVPAELIMKLEQGKLLDYSHLAKEENHSELNEFCKEREHHAMIESIVDGYDTRFKNS